MNMLTNQSQFRVSYRFKNVQFEIKSADEIGLFEVSAKFMGVAMEKVELIFQVGKFLDEVLYVLLVLETE